MIEDADFAIVLKEATSLRSKLLSLETETKFEVDTLKLELERLE